MKDDVRNKMLPSYSDFKKMVFNCQTTQRYIPEKCNFNSHYRENLILQYSDMIYIFLGQKHPQGAPAMRRPATALAVPDASMNNPHEQLRRHRPFSGTKGLAFIQNKILKIYSAESSEQNSSVRIFDTSPNIKQIEPQ